jgi:hypothetical protein
VFCNTSISLERRGTGSAKEEEVTLPVVIKHGELMMEIRLHVCNRVHYGDCKYEPYDKCGRKGHATRDCGKPPVCYSCGIEGHIKANYPGTDRATTAEKGKGAGTSKNNTRVFVMSAEEARRMEKVITGMFLINDTYAHILFDSGKIKSFVSINFMPCLKGILDGLDKPYVVEMANGQEAKVDKVLKNCVIKIKGHELPLELLPMLIGGIDIVLGMDWLTINRASINCAQKTLDVRLPDGSRIEIKGDKPGRTNSLISMMKA